MAVHDRRYRPYEGPLTDPRLRFLVLPRSCFREIFRPRSFTALFTASLAFPVACAFLIYVQHNLSLLGSVPFELPRLISIDARFFLAYLWVQTGMAFLLTLIVVPAVMAPDLVNGALPLYLARPISRRGYLGGKVLALVALLSAVTWIPGVLLYLLEGGLSGEGWILRSSRLLLGILVGSFAAIGALGLPALAISIHLRSKARARGTIVFLAFVLAAVGQIVNAALGTTWGEALNAARVLDVVYAHLLGATGVGQIPLWGALGAIVAACVLSLAVIDRRLRAFEVVS